MLKKNNNNRKGFRSDQSIEQLTTTILNSLNPKINYVKDQEMNLLYELGRFESSEIENSGRLCIEVINKFVFYNYQKAFHVHIPFPGVELPAVVCVNNKIAIEIS